ncbi:MAG: bifunctional diguanylate cyclase/phosphodiesterase [Rhodocyclaceae bacterium]|nr:bifunctional diguanylate cyclase/phosphodiesterase [Rhodocyclaceae bacterium]
MRIRSFILSASALVAAALFVLTFYAASSVLERTVRENARQATQATADVGFAAMYRLMSTGWKRPQVEEFLASIRAAAGNEGLFVEVYRGPAVVAEFGVIAQATADEAVERIFSSGKVESLTTPSGIRHLKPLVADARCLRCHEAEIGAVLGVFEVRQDFAPLLASARSDFLWWLAGITPLIVLMAIFVVWRVNRRLEESITGLDMTIEGVNRVSDLTHLTLTTAKTGFEEIDRVFDRLAALVARLRQVAVDKDVLMFEMRLLEKFIITADVVRDWEETISGLLKEIDRVTPTHFLFSLFYKEGSEYELDIFWCRHVAETTRKQVENHIRRLVAQDPRFIDPLQLSVREYLPERESDAAVFDEADLALQTRSLILETPKIGGIVGIGVGAEVVRDPTLRLVIDSVLATMLNVIGSVKAIHKYTRDMEYYATRDPLTDLYNRRVFWELFEYEIGRAQRQHYSFALLLIDLDNFKLINDGYGHAIGDKYLQAVARTLRELVRPGDILGRYGGDEFVAILPDTDLAGAENAARRLLAAGDALEIEAADGRRVNASFSIGVALYPLHGETAKDLFLMADSMMYKAKQLGRDQIVVPSRDEAAEAIRSANETTLMVIKAVDEKRIVPYFQPIVDLSRRGIAAFEVLSRLTLEDKRLEAGRFIEYAEKAGVIQKMDLMVMDQALAIAAEEGFPGQLFLNLSPRALVIRDFIDSLRSRIESHGLHPEQIVFEITERDTVKNIVVLEKLIAELKYLGCRLAIDDFGSGFSSFQYLRRFPVDYLKIEGEFILNLLTNAKDRSFVATITQLARELKIATIAEFVESAEVLAELTAIGIDYGQGYHLGRPAARPVRLSDYPWLTATALSSA